MATRPSNLIAMIAVPGFFFRMPGQKRDARLRADDPGIHQNKMQTILDQ
jgi:hypothetical protein